MINVTAIIESVLFANSEPISCDKLAQICSVSKDEIIAALEQLKQRYDSDDSGIELLRLENFCQIASKPRFAPYIKAAIEIRRASPLSAAAMEVLAIIAYNQPVTKAFVEQIRGIDSSSVVNTLYERELIDEAGRMDLPGRPLAYRTTENFLRCFGLTKLSDLPLLPGDDGAEQLSFDVVDDAHIVPNEES